MKRALVLLSLVLPLAACGGGNELHDVDASRLGDGVWPLSVEEGRIDCIGRGRATLIAEGETYALNGLAVGAGDGQAIDSIWLDDPDSPGLKMSMRDLTAYANNVCG